MAAKCHNAGKGTLGTREAMQQAQADALTGGTRREMKRRPEPSSGAPHFTGGNAFSGILIYTISSERFEVTVS
jgi:hypothetical protein